MDHSPIEIICLLQPIDFEGGFIEIDEGLDEEGVVFRIALHPTSSPINRPSSSTVLPHLLKDEAGRLFCPIKIDFISGHLISIHKTGDHQTIPGGQDLLIPARLDPLLSLCKQYFSSLFHKASKSGSGHPV